MCLVDVIWLRLADLLDDISFISSLVFFTQSGRQYVNDFFCLVWLPRAYTSPFEWTFKYVRGFFLASLLTNKKQQSTLPEFEHYWQPYLQVELGILVKHTRIRF